MLRINVAVQEKNLDFIFGHKNGCNKFPVEIEERKFNPGQLKFFGPHLALNISSKLYEGYVLFFEPSDGNQLGVCGEALDFTWLLTDLLNINWNANRRPVTYVAYFSSIAHQPNGAEVQQSAIYCCGSNRVR